MSAPPFPALAELQRFMSELIRAPEGVAAGMQDLISRGLLESDDLSYAIDASDRLAPHARLDIYASMYFFRLLDCLADDFPKTKERLGDAHFNNLITDYLLAHPPSHYSLREAGRALPGFLAGHELATTFPAAGDTAQLEWARVDVFDDFDVSALNRDTLLEGSEQEPEYFSIRFIPAARLVEVDSRVLAQWDSPEDAFDPADPGEGTVAVVVWRKGFRVLHRRAVEDEARCFAALAQAGVTLPELAEMLLKPDASAERTSERFAALLELWIQNELLTDARA